jgi:hypothetical protein
MGRRRKCYGNTWKKKAGKMLGIRWFTEIGCKIFQKLEMLTYKQHQNNDSTFIWFKSEEMSMRKSIFFGSPFALLNFGPFSTIQS